MMKKNILVISFLLFTMTLSACATSATSVATKVSEPVQEVDATSVSSKALFQIVKADGTKFDVTLDAVKALPLAQLTVEGKVQEGPKLLDVLSLAGVTDFSEVTLTGSSAPNILTRAQVDDNTVLDFSNRGTMKLATTYISKAEWTKDITEITVK
jgi:hypothetical protein